MNEQISAGVTRLLPDEIRQQSRVTSAHLLKIGFILLNPRDELRQARKEDWARGVLRMLQEIHDKLAGSNTVMKVSSVRPAEVLPGTSLSGASNTVSVIRPFEARVALSEKKRAELAFYPGSWVPEQFT